MAPPSDFFQRVKFSLTYTEMAWHDDYVTPLHCEEICKEF